MVMTHCCHFHRMELLAQFVSTTLSGTSVVQSLRLLKDIIGMFSANGYACCY